MKYESAGTSIDILRKPRAKAVVEKNLGPEDEIEFVLQNGNGYALVALRDRLLIAKFGSYATGAYFSDQAAAYRYSDITGVEVTRRRLIVAVEILTAGHEGTRATAKTKWSDLAKEPHVLVGTKVDLILWKPWLGRLSKLIR